MRSRADGDQLFGDRVKPLSNRFAPLREMKDFPHGIDMLEVTIYQHWMGHLEQQIIKDPWSPRACGWQYMEQLDNHMEEVLVINTADLQSIGRFQGAVRFRSDKLASEIMSLPSKFIARETAEEDPSYKQLIPYIILTRGGLPLFYRRTKSGGEARLHGKVSYGFGGHINPIDTEPGGSTADRVYRGALRELNEELEITGKGRENIEMVGLVNDETTPVGAVHLGLVHCMEICETAGVMAREKEVELLGFMHTAWARQYDNWESWTNLCASQQMHNHEPFVHLPVQINRDALRVKLLQYINTAAASGLAKLSEAAFGGVCIPVSRDAVEIYADDRYLGEFHD